MSEVELLVNGSKYAGWKSVRVTRTIQGLAGSFALDVSDRWGTELWPIVEGDECSVLINGQPAITGYIDRRSISASSTSRTLAYQGRDRAAAMVDSSAYLSRWTLRDMETVDVVRKIAAAFGCDVAVQGGLKLDRISKLVVAPGDTAYEVIRAAIVDQGVLIVSDGVGGILLTRAGSTRGAPLVEGVNIESASVDYDATGRYYRYVVVSQSAGTDEAPAGLTRARAEAIDEDVRRTDRTLIVRPEKGTSTEHARRRADWEARIRAARAETVTVSVQGWDQPGGLGLWRPNLLAQVSARRLLGVDGDMLVSQVDYSIGNDGGQVTQLQLVRPDAFAPEPKSSTTPRIGGAGLWKELAKGGL